MGEIKTITFEGVNFNATHLVKVSESDFIKEFENHKAFAAFKAADRKKLLKDAYAACKRAAGETHGGGDTPAAAGFE